MGQVLTNLPLSSSPSASNLKSSCTVSSHASTPDSVSEWSGFQADALSWCLSVKPSFSNISAPFTILESRPEKATKIQAESFVYVYFAQQIAPAFDALYSIGILGHEGLMIGAGNLNKGN